MNGSQATGKQHAFRIPLDYYKKPDPVFKRKLVLTGVAGVAAVVWLATLVLPGKSSPLNNNRFSHGTVCTHHQPFVHDCSACHVNFAFIGAKNENGSFKGDNKCMECHLDQGGAFHHEPHQLISMTPNCGVCHQDHKGANHHLKRVRDDRCTECHKDLEKSMPQGQKCNYLTTITSFTDQHPAFRSTKTDPGRLKFNHLYHMTRGIVLSSGGKPF